MVATLNISEGTISDASLTDWSKRLGQKLVVSNVFNTEITEDSVRHFTDGIGDSNPLWRNASYARSTSYSRIPAPPNWLYSVFPTWVLQGLRGIHAFHSGNEWTFYRPMRIRDKITPESVFTGFEAKPSSFAGKMVMEYQLARFRNQNSDLVAEAKTWLVRAERSSARRRGKYSNYQLPHPWTEEELARVEDEVLSSKPRGSDHLFWQDANVGDELPFMVKGPFGLTDMIAYCVGADPVGIRAFASGLELYRKHPAWAVRDPVTSALEPVYAVHYNKAIANAAGLPFPYDVGVQRHCWLIQMLTSYMGDEAWLKKNYAEYRGFFYLSDVLWIKGKVVKKYKSEKDDDSLIDVETHAINQRGEDIMPGYSTIALPNKNGDHWPVKTLLG